MTQQEMAYAVSFDGGAPLRLQPPLPRPWSHRGAKRRPWRMMMTEEMYVSCLLWSTLEDPGVDEHLFLSELLSLGAEVDQLNLPNLAVFESAARRLQLWEERYTEKLRMASDGAGTAGHASERHLFLGGSRPKGAALVSPQLERFVADRLSEEASVLKERRKGREERELLAAATTPSGGGNNNNKKKNKDKDKDKDNP